MKVRICFPVHPAFIHSFPASGFKRTVRLTCIIDMQDLAYSKHFGSEYRSMFDSTESDPFDELLRGPTRPAPPHHLHVYATKHNCHITLTNPDRNSIISKSTGNIGFRKSARGTYDAAYQLSAYILGQIYEGGMLNNIKRLEVVLRGFGVGREAVTKALLGPEGRKLRPKIVQVTDATRLKFGGTRSPRPRRLG